MSLISPAAEALIIEQEVSSEAVYRHKYVRPEWPGGESGVTIGIGYDCGYSKEDGIIEDWAERLPAEMIDILTSCAGVVRESAHALVKTARVQSVVVPWEAALDEFQNVEIPRWLAKVRKVYPNTDQLAPDCLGAIVSLGYNRGLQLLENPGQTRRMEMRNIKVHLQNGDFGKIPAEFRSMKRLWNNGLVARRETEARLFERGLAQMSAG